MLRLDRFGLCASLLAMLAAVNASAADYTAAVSQPYSQRIQRVALAPLKCPRELDCPALEKALAQRLVDAGHSVVGAASVRELMTAANVGDLAQFEHRMILSEGLQVDGFAVVTIREARVDAPAPTRTTGSARFNQKEGDKHAVLELRVVGRDGATLTEASGEAHVGGSRNLQAVTAHLFETMLAEAAKAE